MAAPDMNIANSKLLPIAAGLALSSCLNLQLVHEFSAEALKSTAEFEQVELTFQQLCEKKNVMEAIETGTVLRDYQEDCALQILADSAVFKLQHAIVAYLHGLYLLTANQRIMYSLDPVSQALQESKLVQLEEEELHAYQQIATLITQASTEAYRKRQITSYVTRAHAPLCVVINQLIFIMNESLREAARQQQEMLYLQTRALTDSARSFPEKSNLITAHAHAWAYYSQQFQLLDAYVAILNHVRDGHQQLYEKRDQLDKESTLETLMHYTGEIHRLQSIFEKTK